MFFINLASIGLTLIGLPGIWIMIALAAGVEFWRGDFFSLWTIAACVVLALFGELMELITGAAGSKFAGGSHRSGIGAIIGAIVGAIAGAAFPPVLGAIIWGAVGAGVGAVLLDMTHKDPETNLTKRQRLNQMARIGSGAAAGRLAGTVIKGLLATIVFIILTVASIVP